ncbi:MAG: T9SS type A sorting domain-containing protein [Chitinophagaceae bacterium]|nr:T9SS type A sorting domain-containing protein [Chitinophagaceae bacterium]
MATNLSSTLISATEFDGSSGNVEVSTYFNTVFVPFFKKVIQNNPNDNDYTIVFPMRQYMIINELDLNLSTITGVSATRPLKINIIGIKTPETDINNDPVQFPTSIAPTAFEPYISRTNLSCNYNPASTDFLTLPTTADPFPEIYWDTQNDATVIGGHSPCLLYIKGNSSAVQVYRDINVMGLKFKATNPNYDPNVTHPFLEDYLGYIGIFAHNFLNFDIDNLQIENIYGDGIWIQNGNALDDYPNRLNNQTARVAENIILNVWGFNATAASNGAFDNYGAGIYINVLRNAVCEYNYVYNDLYVTNHFGQSAIVTQFDHSPMVRFNRVHGYDRNIHMEGNTDLQTVQSNRSTGSFCSLLTTDAYTYANGRLICKYNYFGISGIYTKYSALNFPQQIYSDAFIMVHIVNYMADALNEGISLQGTELTENIWDVSCSEYSNWISSSPNTTYAKLFYSNVKDLVFNCNLMKSTGPCGSAPCQVMGFVYNHTEGVTSFSGNSFNGNFYTLISWPYTSISDLPNTFFCNDFTLATYTNSTPNVFLATQCSNSADVCGNQINLLLPPPTVTNITCDGVTNNVNDGAIIYEFPLLPTISPYSFLLNPGSQSNTTGSFTGLGVSNYTVNASDGTNTATHLLSVGTPSTSHCNCTGGEDLVKAPNILLLENPTSSGLLSGNLWQSLIFNKTFFIDGVLTIDQSIEFVGCRFYFTPGSFIDITNASTLSLKACKLSAGCDQMWDGIYADDPSEHLVITNSWVKDMENGIQVSNGAAITCIGNDFIDNYVSLVFSQTPVWYVSGLNGNMGKVIKNRFTSSGNALLYPHGAMLKAGIGINLRECAEIEIGELLEGSWNMFKNIECGIGVLPSNQSDGVLNILNNNFEDIRADYSAFAPYNDNKLLNNIYIEAKGSGIFTWSTPATSTYNTLINIDAVKLNTHFINCDKAIVGSNISASVTHYDIENCKAGIMFNDDLGENYYIENNDFINVFRGIQLIGNLRTAIIQNNIGDHGGIDLQLDPILNDQGKPMWPIGIDVQFNDNKHNGLVLVNNNEIAVNSIAGTGIFNALTGAALMNKNNTITFKTTDATNSNTDYLMGIHSWVTKGSINSCNIINGLNNSAFNARHSIGFQTFESTHNFFDCNFANYTWMGMMTMGDCSTPTDNVRGNTFLNHIYGMLFMPGISLTEGTFGNIGSTSADKFNRFLGSYNNSGNNNMYRYNNSGSSSLPYYLYTTENINSGSNLGFAYNIIPGGTTQYYCGLAECASDAGNEEHILDVSNETSAIGIANNSIQYLVAPEVSQYMAERRLYAELDVDSNMRANNSILNSFYIQRQQEALGAIYESELMINTLTDSIALADSMVFQNRLLNAENQNQNISSVNTYELNERWINEIQFKVIRYGRDSLNEIEIDELEALAKSCPLLEGFAVYKARILYTYYEPAYKYEDYSLCSSQMNNKNGIGVYDSLLYFQNTLGTNALSQNLFNNTLSNGEEYSLYPNPAKDYITIDYDFNSDKDATISLYDVLGRKVKSILLKNENQSITFSTNDLKAGIYTYNINGAYKVYAGKITIFK